VGGLFIDEEFGTEGDLEEKYVWSDELTIIFLWI
jgi:hypothetical protein